MLYLKRDHAVSQKRSLSKTCFVFTGQIVHGGKFKHLIYSENFNFPGTNNVESIIVNQWKIVNTHHLFLFFHFCRSSILAAPAMSISVCTLTSSPGFIVPLKLYWVPDMACRLTCGVWVVSLQNYSPVTRFYPEKMRVINCHVSSSFWECPLRNSLTKVNGPRTLSAQKVCI